MNKEFLSYVFLGKKKAHKHGHSRKTLMQDQGGYSSWKLKRALRTGNYTTSSRRFNKWF